MPSDTPLPGYSDSHLLPAYRRQARSRAFGVLIFGPSTGANTTEQLSFDDERQPAARQQ